MKEGIRKFLPPYFVEKFEGVEEKQVKALPAHLRQAMIHGTEADFISAFDRVEAMERSQGKKMLGRAAVELINDMREHVLSERRGS